MLSPVKIWRRQKTIRDLLNKRGVIVSWTRIYTPPPQFKKIAPYVVAIIKLENGKKICTQVVDISSNTGIRVNMPVRTTLRKLRESVPDDVIPYTVACVLV